MLILCLLGQFIPPGTGIHTDMDCGAACCLTTVKRRLPVPVPVCTLCVAFRHLGGAGSTGSVVRDEQPSPQARSYTPVPTRFSLRRIASSSRAS